MCAVGSLGRETYEGAAMSEQDQNHARELEDLAAELLQTQRGVRDRLAESNSDLLLQAVAGELGEVLIRLSRDERLRQLTSGAARSWRDRSLRSQLGQLLLIDWPGLLSQSAYQEPPPAQDLADDFLRATVRFVGKPSADSYEPLRSYLFDLGTRLLDDADEPPPTARRRSRLARGIGRGLWVIGRVGLAAAVGGLVGAVFPPAGPWAGAAMYAAMGDAVKEMAKALVEEVIPKPGDTASTTREDLEFDERATNLNDLLRADDLGRLRVHWETARATGASGDDLRVLAQHTLAWCSAAQAATLAMRSLGAALWNGPGDLTLDSLARQLARTRSSVRDGQIDQAIEDIEAIPAVSFETLHLLESQRYRNHP
jgi:hypothetical protein